MGRQHGSSNWIKVQKHTWQKGEIRQVARALNVSLGDAFLMWFRLYSAFDELTADGNIPFYRPEDADQDAGTAGAGDAFAMVRWLMFDDYGCTIANWGRHNGESAKARALKAERQARYRDGVVDATPSTPVDATPSTPVVPERRAQRLQSIAEQSRRFTQDAE